MVGRLKSENSGNNASLSLMYGSIAKAAAVLTDWSNCRKYTRMAREAIAADAQQSVDELQLLASSVGEDANANADSDDADATNITGKVVSGGKRPWKETSEARMESLRVSKNNLSFKVFSVFPNHLNSCYLMCCI